MANTEQPSNEDHSDINLKEAAEAYETERQLNRLAHEIERYSPDLLELLADAATQQVDKSDFATRIHRWRNNLGGASEAT